MKPTQTLRLALAACLAPALLAPSAAPLRLDLEASVGQALEASASLRAARLEAEASADLARAAGAALLPRLAADASYRYVAEVPSLSLAPGGRSLPFGDHNNYSLGLSASWDIFAAPALWQQSRAARAQAEAKAAEVRAQARALRLAARLSYFQAQFAASRLKLYGDALKLAQAQARDLEGRLRAGGSSRIDALSAAKAELDQRAAFLRAQVDLGAALRDLFQLCGRAQGEELAAPLDPASAGAPPAGLESPSQVVALQAAPQLLKELAEAGAASLDEAAAPRLAALRALAEAARAQAAQARAAHLPTGGLAFRYSRDYPEMPLLQSVDQQTSSASLSLPLYSFGQLAGRAAAQQALAGAAASRAEGAAAELRRDWMKSRDRLKALRAERELRAAAAEKAEALRAMVYRSYSLGASTFLEAQSARLGALQAGLDLALAETQSLIELATLSALTADR